MTACFPKGPREHKKRGSESSESGYDRKLQVIKDHAGNNNNNNINKLLSPLALEWIPSCYHEDCSKCANNYVLCHDGVLDNLMNYFMFRAFKKFYNLNINKNDKVVLLEILKLKLRVASAEQMELYTGTQDCEAVNGPPSPCIILFSSVCR